MCYVVFYVRRLLRSIVFSRFIDVIAYNMTSLLYMAKDKSMISDILFYPFIGWWACALFLYESICDYDPWVEEPTKK